MSLALRVAAILAFTGAVLTIPSSTAADATVAIGHGDFWITTSQPSVEAGNITFNVANEGAIIHEFKVVRSDLPPDSLPIIEDEFKVDESQVDVLGYTDIMQPGDTRTLTLNLPPGNYVLICNVASHYQAGSYAGFQVTAPPEPTTAPSDGAAAPTAGPAPAQGGIPAVGQGPQEGGAVGSWWLLAGLCALGTSLATLGVVTRRFGR
jgi:uncharacterized cupredoxin-like copper-binding protein